MANIGLKDILISARQESYRMRHFYLGVEHLFIALLEIKGGLASGILEEQGLTPEYVIDAIRRKVGKGSKHRLWAGIPNTPRADVVLGISNDLALESGRKDILERDLLIALLEENDSVPIRVLKALGSDVIKLTEAARTRTLNRNSQQPFVKIDFSAEFSTNNELSRDHLFILRRMFYGYEQIRIERKLTGGYTKALLLVVTPIHPDNREDAPVVVKIDHTDVILDEAQRYESHVKGTLPPLTARLEDKPVAPETSDFAGIKYTLVAGSDKMPRDLRSVVHDWGAERVGEWLIGELYSSFGRIWWQQNRPYRFQVWREYDWLLPPILTLEITKDKPTEEGHVLKFPIKRAKLHELEYGDIVTVESFIVQRVYPDRNIIQLAIGHGNDSARAYKIEVRGLDLASDTYYRGEVVEKITGRVWKTRNELLIHAARALEPDFDLDADKITIGTGSLEKLPNPILAYEDLLDTYINGSLSRIHGDLHLGNIIVGPNGSPSLIDFAHTRDGHTIFDWATLEVSLLSDIVMPASGESWDDARRLLGIISALNAKELLDPKEEEIVDALNAVKALRQIASGCLANEDNWAEYFVALALCGLRAITWETMPMGGRRLMFLVSALAIHELRNRHKPTGGSDATSPDDTDLSNSVKSEGEDN
jgi:ATP-dependent Clp protease ATP-binding subunit ClpC